MTVRELHQQAMAMALAGDAYVYREQGDLAKAIELDARALPIEISAAEMVSLELENEPTRGILYRSAASLAYLAGELEEAERLIECALAGWPTERTCGELEDLWKLIQTKKVVQHERT